MAAYDEYTVAIICAIGFEMSAVRYMLDKEHPRLPTRDGDSNVYILGELNGHNIALACLPGNQGKGAAAVVATNMARTFPSIKWRFLVGIGGGVPSSEHDIRLGDVVVSMPEGPYSGVVQYDLGKDKDDVFELKGFLSAPPSLLRSAVETMRSDHFVQENKIEEYLSQMLQKGPRLKMYTRPDANTDVLFDEAYRHPATSSTCLGCDRSKVITRPARAFEGPEIHYGLIASGDRVIRSAAKRTKEVQNMGDILCFEMEAAGLMTDFSCIVIRGISDYADSHKNNGWQHAAAAAAAACAKELLIYVDPQRANTKEPSSVEASAAQVKCYGNALEAASFGGHEATVRLLLEKGADVNTQGGEDGNALQAASERGHKEVAQLLRASVIAPGFVHGPQAEKRVADPDFDFPGRKRKKAIR